MQLIPHSFRRISPLATPAGMAFQTPIISNHVSNPSTPHSSHKACNGRTQRWLVGLVTFHYRIKYWAITFLLHFGLSQYQVELITMSYRSGCHFPTSHRAAAPKTRSQDTYLQYPYRSSSWLMLWILIMKQSFTVMWMTSRDSFIGWSVFL